MISLPLVFVMLFCSSCMPRTEHIQSRLSELDDLVYSNPSYVLHSLSEIDINSIHHKRHKAKHALLHAIALDKTYKDIENDSIIKPALEYYSKHGPSLDRLRTFYYTARIYENSGDLEKAMEFLAKSEKHKDCDKQNLCLALIYTAKGRIYTQMLDYENGAVNFEEAARIYLRYSNLDRYASNLLQKCSCMIMNGRPKEVDEILAEVYSRKTELSSGTLNKYHQTAINLYQYEHDESPMQLLASYLDDITDPYILDWTMVAGIYLKENMVEEALCALSNQARYRNKDASYHYYMAKALEMSGEYQQAIHEYNIYDESCGSAGRFILNQDTRFIEEREHHNEMHAKARMKSMVLLLTCIVILLSMSLTICIIIATRKQLQLKEHEQRELARQVEELMMEREELAKVNTENKEARKIISERLRIIDNFVFSDVLQDEIFERKASETLKGIISNREEFIRQNRLIFNESHPRFTNYLQEMGLTEKEIEHCCLYAIGLNGKMATTFTNLKRHYHVGSSIRKKLGLNGHDTNISIHIKRLFKELEESQNEYIGLPTCLKDGR